MKLLFGIMLFVFQLKAILFVNAVTLDKDNVNTVCKISIDQEKRFFDCDKKNITEIDPNAFSNVKPDFLDLIGNELTALNPALFKDVSNLNTLWLTDNKLTSLPVNLFSSLNNLERLFLESNQLSRLDVDAFKGLSKIRELWIGENQISSLEQDLIKELTTLERFSIEGNKLTSLDPKTFKALKNIRKLFLERNQIEKIDSSTFQDLPKLENLDLSSNKLTVINSGAFFYLKGSLAELILNDNKLESIPVGDLYCLNPELRLDLCGNDQLKFVDKRNCDDLEKLKFVWEANYGLKPTDCSGDKPPGDNSAVKLGFLNSYFQIYFIIINVLVYFV